jgi:hypothetical protein
VPGSGPALRSAAVSRACSGVAGPDMSAPAAPSIPSGASCQSMNGVETIRSSRTSARCWEVWSGSPGLAWSAPRCASSRVSVVNACCPGGVRSIATVGRCRPAVGAEHGALPVVDREAAGRGARGHVGARGVGSGDRQRAVAGGHLGGQVGGHLRIARPTLDEAQERAGVAVLEPAVVLQVGGQQGIVRLVHMLTAIERAGGFVTAGRAARPRRY